MIVLSIAKGFHKLTKNIPSDLSPKELDRLRAIILWYKTKDTSLVCNTYGISRATLYRWIKRFDPKEIRPPVRVRALDACPVARISGRDSAIRSSAATSAAPSCARNHR